MTERGLLYALVARGTTVLAECTEEGVSGNFSTVAITMLHKVSAEDGVYKYSQDSYHFQLIVQDKLTFLVMATAGAKKSLPMKFLRQTRIAFLDQFGDRVHTARALAFDVDFRSTFKRIMRDAREGDGRLDQIKSEIDAAKSVMGRNIEKAIDRGENLEYLGARSENIHSRSVTFNRQATSLRKHFCCKNVKFTLLLVLSVFIVIFVIVLLACGGFTFKHCK